MYVLALDQGTSSSRAIVFDRKGRIVSLAQQELTNHFPKAGWVEQNPDEILRTQLAVAEEAVRRAGIDPREIAAAGIANQRETTIVWDKATGKAIHPAIVWQCRRTAEMIRDMSEKQGFTELVRDRTGLVPDAYFSGSKVRWILDAVEGARERAARGELLFGTVDSWLIWNMTKGKVHATDPTNASRTMLFNIRDMRWDPELLDLFDIPSAMLPEVLPSDGDFGTLAIANASIPIRGVLGDQQASMFAQQCFSPGDVKITYGTGCFMLMNVGDRVRLSDGGLLTTVGYVFRDKTAYALEGSVFIGGAIMQWIRDELKMIREASEVGPIAQSVPDNGGVYIVPAFTGLGAPYWDMSARGTILGLTRGTGRAHIIRAAEEAIAYQCLDLIRTAEADSGVSLSVLRADGGASRDTFLMQFQSDILNARIEKPSVSEMTAWGVASLAGFGAGLWKDIGEWKALFETESVYEPAMDDAERLRLTDCWHNAVASCRTWQVE